jgi:hypothetical protein
MRRSLEAERPPSVDDQGSARSRKIDCIQNPYRGLFPSPPLFDRMPTYRTQGKRSLNFLSASANHPFEPDRTRLSNRA